MDLGFETIGNATVIAHDGGPLLTTDPWLEGPAYFGSWKLSHAIPDEQLESIRKCPYLWISHGHPDHLSMPSLEKLRDKEILLPDHYGGRVARELGEQGFNVRVLPCGEWVRLGDRLRICCIADVYQDALLLIDLDGHLIVDANDCGDHGVGAFLQQTVRKYDSSFLLCLTGHGDADMINFFDEDGNRVIPGAAKKEPLGPGIGGLLVAYGVRDFVPFSSMHRYQRTDSAWANQYLTPIGVHDQGFELAGSRVLPAFVSYDLARDDFRAIDPPESSHDLFPPEEFGDNWSDELETSDRAALDAYVRSSEHLHRFLGFVTFRVGGKDHTVDVAPDFSSRGITFEVPRASLMTAVEYQVFDDILIGNFAKTTLHGGWSGKRGTAALYPDLGPYWTKFGDNGGARTATELRDYLWAYRERGYFIPGLGPGGDELARSVAPYLE